MRPPVVERRAYRTGGEEDGPHSSSCRYPAGLIVAEHRLPLSILSDFPEPPLVEVAPSFESTNSAYLKSIGATGVVGIRLFKLGFFGGISVLSKLDRKKAPQVEAEVLKGKLKSDW